MKNTRKLQTAVGRRTDSLQPAIDDGSLTMESPLNEPGPTRDTDSPAAASAAAADDAEHSSAEPIDTSDADGLPTSFGVFKPVGYLMVGLPSQAQLEAMVAALRDAGWAGAAVREFAPRDSVADLQAMVDNAGPLAGFGYEITLLRRYLSLTEAGCRWLLVKVDDSQPAEATAGIARTCGATLAIHYRTLTVEELIV